MGHMLKLNRETQASNWSYPIEPDGRVLGSKPSSLSQIKKTKCYTEQQKTSIIYVIRLEKIIIPIISNFDSQNKGELGFSHFLKRLLDTKKSDDLMWKLWSLCLPIDMVDAHPTILTGHWLTLVYISLAVWTCDSWDAYTLVASDPVHTGPSILTGRWLTLIYVCFTSRIWNINCQVKTYKWSLTQELNPSFAYMCTMISKTFILIALPYLITNKYQLKKPRKCHMIFKSLINCIITHGTLPNFKWICKDYKRTVPVMWYDI